MNIESEIAESSSVNRYLMKQICTCLCCVIYEMVNLYFRHSYRRSIVISRYFMNIKNIRFSYDCEYIIRFIKIVSGVHSIHWKPVTVGVSMQLVATPEYN